MNKHSTISFNYHSDEPFSLDLRKRIARACRRWGVDNEISLHIQIAVDEACTNIVHHAYQNTRGRIKVEIKPLQQKIKTVIKDWGKSFSRSYGPVSKPQCVINAKKEGGLGIFTIIRLMDEVKYNRRNKHNELVMIKKRKKSND